MSNYIALQLYGLVRGFKFEYVRNNIYEKIIKQLEEQGFIVHIFWHTYDIEFDNIINNLQKDKFDIKKIEIDSHQESFDYLKNNYKLKENYKFYSHWTEQQKYGWFLFTKSMCKVNRLRQEYQNKNNIHYKWVIYTSGQMNPQNNIDNITRLNNNFLHSPSYYSCGGFYDSFFLINSDIADYIGDLYNFMINNLLIGFIV